MYKSISQCFEYNESNISSITLRYLGKAGYPSDIVTVALYDDYDNNPDNLITKTQIQMPNTDADIAIDFDTKNLKENKYWIVIQDNNANENNYHKFAHNAKKTGTLIIEDNKRKYIDDSHKLQFEVNAYHNIQTYNDVPSSWGMSYDEELPYKITSTLYRYNTNSYNNVSISNLIIKNGKII